MIPEFAIREWGEQVPWTETEQVEQDLLICRALTEIYKDHTLHHILHFVVELPCISCSCHPSPDIARISTLYKLKRNR